MNRLWLIPLGMAAFAAGCEETWVDTAAPIIGGAPDTGDPAVVVVTTRIGSSTTLCSGTLISPRVVLTAAHCLDKGDAPSSESVYFGTQREEPDPGAIETIKVVDRVWFEPWDLWSGDIGMVLLARPAATEPVEINRTPLTLAEHGGDPIRFVGWGNTSPGSGNGTKRVVTVPLDGFHNPDVLKYGNAQSNTCSGDSGGPGFMTIDDREVVAGVTSFGFGNCDAASGATNVVQFVDFIDAWVATHDGAMQSD